VQEKFVSIDNKFKKIDDSLSTFFVCENCGYDRVQGLSSYCPQCGNPIYEWNDDDGKPIKGWVPFVDRSKK
jgi:rubrerythrin